MAGAEFLVRTGRGEERKITTKGLGGA